MAYDTCRYCKYCETGSQLAFVDESGCETAVYPCTYYGNRVVDLDTNACTHFAIIDWAKAEAQDDAARAADPYAYFGVNREDFS